MLKGDKVDTEINIEPENNLNNIRYICDSNKLITESLKNGCDVAQLPNGDIVITEVKVVNTYYKWDKERRKMVKVNTVL